MGWWSSLHRKGRRWVALPPGDRLIVLQAWALLTPVGIARRLTTFHRLRGWLGRGWTAALSHDPVDQARAQRIAELVQIAAAYALPRPNCLERSLVLWTLLGRRGLGCDLRFGVRRTGSALEAHAWVERGGVILNDTPEMIARFTVIAAPP